MSAASTTKSRHSGKRPFGQNWSDTARSWPSLEGNNLRRALSPMPFEPLLRRYRNRYAKLLRLYPKPYRERFGEAMEQTFHDLCRERVKTKSGLFSFAL